MEFASRFHGIIWEVRCISLLGARRKGGGGMLGFVHPGLVCWFVGLCD